MNTDAIKRFLTALSSAVKVERGQLYQLVQSAEASYYLRDLQSQHEIALLLQSFGYPFSQVGKYYESIYLYRSGQFEKARELLECVAESAPARYRSKALLSLAGVEERIGRFEESLRFRLQVSSCDDPVTMLEAQCGMAARRGIEGEHEAALRDLERFLPLAHIIGKRGHPAYTTFLNSYAVELSESNRTEEAEQVASVIAASPFLGRYPEWQETVSEIETRRKHSSTVAVGYPRLESKVISDSRVRDVVDFMKANLHSHVTLSDLAEVVNLSTSHISYLFRTHVDTSPIEYLVRLRMERARELLATTYLNIKEIMVAVGYSHNNRSGFLDHFKRYYKLTPTEYRKLARARR
ncbi:MAG TPA: AraC family transcriptional regulator [Blastocatellia bacterium]|nr:AraC family transcriptional regulator [Blastocatellia bacterium]